MNDLIYVLLYNTTKTVLGSVFSGLLNSNSHNYAGNESRDNEGVVGVGVVGEVVV